jgi:hypothetical protein
LVGDARADGGLEGGEGHKSGLRFCGAKVPRAFCETQGMIFEKFCGRFAAAIFTQFTKSTNP